MPKQSCEKMLAAVPSRVTVPFLFGPPPKFGTRFRTMPQAYGEPLYHSMFGSFAVVTTASTELGIDFAYFSMPAAHFIANDGHAFINHDVGLILDSSSYTGDLSTT